MAIFLFPTLEIAGARNIARVKGRACPCHAKAKAKSYIPSMVHSYTKE